MGQNIFKCHRQIEDKSKWESVMFFFLFGLVIFYHTLMTHLFIA